MQFNLVTPEKRLSSIDVSQVQIPATEGDMTAMEGHSPTITTLRPGLLKAGESDENAYVVTGGFAEILGASVSVLAERAVALASASPEILDSMIEELRAAVELADDKVAAQTAVSYMEDFKRTLFS